MLFSNTQGDNRNTASSKTRLAAKAASAYITFLAGCGAFWEREACAVFWVLTVISDKEQNSEGHRPETACVPGVFSRAVKHDVYKQRFAPDE